MILSAQSIRQRCQCNPPLIDPFVERTMSPGGNSFGLGPASYDVRLDQRLGLAPPRFTLASALGRFSPPPPPPGVGRRKGPWAPGGLQVVDTPPRPGRARVSARG